MSERRFLYHAHGVALSGRITQPFQAEIEGQAATSLASIGGYASSKADGYLLNDIISYESAHSYVSGVKTADGTYHTSITSIIKGLSILHVITADAIICRLSSKHAGERQPEITPLGSEFKNLRIANQAVHVELDHARFANHPTHDALVTHLAKTDRSKAAVKPRYHWGVDSDALPPGPGKDMLVPSETGYRLVDGMLHTTMVKTVRVAGPVYSSEERPYGYAIHVPHVGNLYLAELYSTGDTKRLCMLRLELGCPVVGVVAASEGVANGSWG